MYKDSFSKKLRAFVCISFLFFLKENIIHILQTSSSEHEKTVKIVGWQKVIPGHTDSQQSGKFRSSAILGEPRWTCSLGVSQNLSLSSTPRIVTLPSC